MQFPLCITFVSLATIFCAAVAVAARKIHQLQWTKYDLIVNIQYCTMNFDGRQMLSDQSFVRKLCSDIHFCGTAAVADDDTNNASNRLRDSLCVLFWNFHLI